MDKKEKYIAPTIIATLIITNEHALQGGIVSGTAPGTSGEQGDQNDNDFARQQSGFDDGFGDGTFDFGSWND